MTDLSLGSSGGTGEFRRTRVLSVLAIAAATYGGLFAAGLHVNAVVRSILMMMTLCRAARPHQGQRDPDLHPCELRHGAVRLDRRADSLNPAHR